MSEVAVSGYLWALLGFCLGVVLTTVLMILWQQKQRTGKQDQQERQLTELAKLPLYAEQINKLEAANQDLLASLRQAEDEKTRAETLLNEARELEERMTESFENLSHKILKSRMTEFDEDAQKTQEAQQKSIEAMLKPLSVLIDESRKKTDELEKQNVETRISLTEAIKGVVQRTEELHNTNTRLASALSNSKGRGDWGELELARLLEASGLVEGVHYEKQQTESSLRPDIKVYLSNGRFLYIDAKTIMVNLERALTDDSATEAEERKLHVKALEEEIKKLSVKSYEELIKGSLDFVVLYLPRESMLHVALEEKPSLMTDTLQKKIILASPLNLLAILKTVAYGWQQESLSRNAEEIRTLAIELHKRSATFLEKFQKVGTRIEAAMGAYEEASTSFQGRLGFVPQMKKIGDLGARSKKELPEEFTTGLLE